jgi:hypothetical protein
MRCGGYAKIPSLNKDVYRLVDAISRTKAQVLSDRV